MVVPTAASCAVRSGTVHRSTKLAPSLNEHDLKWKIPAQQLIYAAQHAVSLTFTTRKSKPPTLAENLFFRHFLLK